MLLGLRGLGPRVSRNDPRSVQIVESVGVLRVLFNDPQTACMDDYSGCHEVSLTRNFGEIVFPT